MENNKFYGKMLKRYTAAKYNRMYNYLYYIFLFCLSISFNPYHVLIFNQFINQISCNRKNTIYNIAITFAIYYFGFMDSLYYFSIIKFYEVLSKCDSFFVDKIYTSLSDNDKKVINSCKNILTTCCNYISTSTIVVNINSSIDECIIYYGIDKYLNKIDTLEEPNSDDENLIKEISTIATNLEKSLHNGSFSRKQRRRY